MLNKATIQGRLVADPELKYTQSNIPVLQARVACDRDYRKDGQQNADFINIVAWRQTAEFVAKYFRKGDMILLEGRIQARDYTDRDGNKRYVTEIAVDHVWFSGSKRDSGTQDRQSYQHQEPDVAYEDFPEDGELPF